MVERLRWLVGGQHVRPEDILVLAPTRRRVEGLAGTIRSAGVPAGEEVHVARDDQDRILRKGGCLTLATAKGYDAYCALLASANEFTTDVSGRASFYVGCNRAIEYLEVFAHDRTGLVGEIEGVGSARRGRVGLGRRSDRLVRIIVTAIGAFREAGH